MIGYDEVRKTYFVLIEYRDQNGKRLQKKKHGFTTKIEARAWENETRDKLCRNVMDFRTLATTYFATLEVIRSTHDLRHSHASILLNDPTISVAAVSARFGHSNIATTMKVYTHVIDKATKSLNEKITSMAKIQ